MVVLRNFLHQLLIPNDYFDVKRCKTSNWLFDYSWSDNWFDVYMMIIPGSVGHLNFGFMEIGMFLGFLGLFLFIVFRSFAKAPMTVKNHPYLEESKHLHI